MGGGGVARRSCALLPGKMPARREHPGWFPTRAPPQPPPHHPTRCGGGRCRRGRRLRGGPRRMLGQPGRDLREAAPEARWRGGPGARRGMRGMLFHLLSLFRLLACPAGQERAAAAGCPRPAGPGAGPAGCVGSVEDVRASLESGNSSLFSPPSAARTPKVILRPPKQKRRPARH